MHAYASNFAAAAAPGLVLVAVGLIAALPPYRPLRRFNRGRARSSIGYLAGLFIGLGATAAMGTALAPLADANLVGEAGFLGAAFGPFVGLARARWAGPRKPPRRAAWAR
jgi:hypothetical protein